MGDTLTHTNDNGEANMVDVSSKNVTRRSAIAEGYVDMKPETLDLIMENQIAKGDVLAVCRVAGILAAKKCSELIPLCHGLNLSSVNITFEPISGDNVSRLHIKSECVLNAQTGVEMEALTAVSVAALAVYDMCKAVDKGMQVNGIRLLEKHGGKSGSYYADELGAGA